MPRPNFVFTMTDTQGANVTGAYGHPELDTPTIDNLARSAIRFTRAYTTCPLCTPARRRFQWNGRFHPRPADGYAPEVRDYDTGMPSRGAKTEFRHQEEAAT